jgi:hypothetical protein
LLLGPIGGRGPEDDEIPLVGGFGAADEEEPGGGFPPYPDVELEVDAIGDRSDGSLPGVTLPRLMLNERGWVGAGFGSRSQSSPCRGEILRMPWYDEAGETALGRAGARAGEDGCDASISPSSMVFVVPLEMEVSDQIDDVFVRMEAPNCWTKLSGVGAGVGVDARCGMRSVTRSFGLEEGPEAGVPLGEDTSGAGDGVRRELGSCPFGLPLPTGECEGD